MVTIRGRELTGGELLKEAFTALVGVAIAGGIIAGGVAVIVHGSREIAGAYDDPNPAIRCTAERASSCVRVERGRVQQGDIAADVYVVTERRVEPIQLVEDARPEAGSIVELETRGSSIVSLHDPVSGRRYRTEDWPRHGRDAGHGVFVILLGLALASAVVLPLIATGVQALRRARRSSAAV
jgi:hypothetical protein